MKKIPVTAVIHGERKVVGEAQIDKNEDGEFIADLVIDSSAMLGKMAPKTLGPFSIGRRDCSCGKYQGCDVCKKYQ